MAREFTILLTLSLDENDLALTSLEPKDWDWAELLDLTSNENVVVKQYDSIIELLDSWEGVRRD